MHNDLQNQLKKLDDIQLSAYGLKSVMRQIGAIQQFNNKFKIDFQRVFDCIVLVASFIVKANIIDIGQFAYSFSKSIGEISLHNDDFSAKSTYILNHMFAISEVALRGIAKIPLNEREKIILITYPIEIEWANASPGDEIRYPDKQDPDFTSELDENTKYLNDILCLSEIAFNAKKIQDQYGLSIFMDRLAFVN